MRTIVFVLLLLSFTYSVDADKSCISTVTGWTVTAPATLSSGPSLLVGNNTPSSADWFFVAPAVYRGVQSNKVEFSFGFSVNTLVITPSTIGDDVIISGTNTELYWTLTPQAFVTVYSLSLDTFTAWKVRPLGSSSVGRDATEADIAAVISYITCIKIRGKFSPQPHDTALASPFLCDGTDPTIVACPVGSNGLDCSGHGTCFQGTCTCNFGWFGADCGNRSRCGGGRFPVVFQGPSNPLLFQNLVQGNVTDSFDFGSRAVPGVTVDVIGTGSSVPISSTTTDAKGNFYLPTRLVPGLSYSLRVSKLFYRTQILPLNSISPTSTFNIVFYLNQKKRNA